jgi:hypothetical protein
MSGMATPPESTKYSLHHRLATHARQRWPQVADVDVRFRGAFAYVEAHLADGTVQPLVRLRYGGSAQHWGFGLYLASSGRYEDQILPSGLPIGSPEEALNCAGGLYLSDPA